MPRQAARLVLGRSATRPTLPIRPRTFSTTPRHLEDDAGSSSSNKPSRRERSVAAASALGAMSRPSDPTRTAQQKPQVLDARKLGGSRPANFVRPSSGPGAAQNNTPGGRPGNIISLKSLPGRPDGAPGKPFFRRTGAGQQEGGQGGPAPTGRFVRRTNGPGITRAPQGSGGPGARFQGRPGPGGAGGMRGRPKRQARKPRRENDKKKEEDERNSGGLSAMDEEVRAYIREQEVGGVARAYKPSTTLESLVGWGPAVATNTAVGQADIAMRNVRVLGGGRPHVEGEQSFKINDVKTWLARNKPIYFSSIEQKKAAMETLSHEKREKVIQANMDAIVKEIQKKNGNNWGAFVGAFKEWAAKMPSTEHGKKLAATVGENATPEAWLRAAAEHKANTNLEALAAGYKTQNTKTTRDAIAKFALKGEHPEVKYAQDVWGKLAMYHAHGSTYRATDGEKFDEKMRKLIKVVPAAGKAAPKARARS